ncbi:MAG: hypothetical protein KAG66_21675, partial [Methylococcales bacterium]|nr:hypothetical protein [Methylococcales bacterium]
WVQEDQLRTKRREELNAGIPPPSYDTLFGRQQSHQHILNHLESTPTIALIGIGGIGKTSLAHSIATTFAQYCTFDRIIWLRVGAEDGIHTTLPNIQINNFLSTLASQLFPHDNNLLDFNGLKEKIRQRLKANPHLIIIDNAEADTLTQQLLHLIQNWGNPTKFILTSRSHPNRSFSVFNFQVPEISINDARKLIQHQATLVNVTALTTIDHPTTEKIYNIIGGNPLALKLVVGLAAIIPLPHILTDLVNSHSNQIEAMYTHIYHKVWHSLTPTAQSILQIMPLIANTGALPAQISAISGIKDNGILFAGIAELANHSLLEVRGTLHQRRYSIHRLTASFLQIEINDWKK